MKFIFIIYNNKGTSACVNAKFYCNNEGSVGHYIPSSRVNDGVCGYYLFLFFSN